MSRRAPTVITVLMLVALSQQAQAVCSRTCADRPEGCDKGFGTVAYVVTTCRVIENGQRLGMQELRVQRSGCDPISVMALADPEPVNDFAGLCTLVGNNHQGTSSPLAGVFQRLGVTPDGSGVVFEVTNESQKLVGKTPLTDEQQGFFYVRADGTELRRLGSASHDDSYRLFTTGDVVSVDVTTRLAFNGREVFVFSDLAPGPDGEVTEQLFAMELASGERRQLTHLTAPTAPPPLGQRVIAIFNFVLPKRIQYVHTIGDRSELLDVSVDGRDLPPPPPHPGVSSDGPTRVVPTFRQSGLEYGVFGATLPGPAANPGIYPVDAQPFELFSQFDHPTVIQLTNFRYSETDLLGIRPKDVVFIASADPVGENPFHNCQLFRVSPLGLGVRQLTHFDVGRPSEEGCQLSERPGCGIKALNSSFQVHATRELLFYSDCNPLGTNPDGGQVFAMRWNGSQLRQLTRTRGTTRAADGSVVEVEIPGPVAWGSR